jgi:hypothetical protein
MALADGSGDLFPSLVFFMKLPLTSLVVAITKGE